VHSGSIIVDVAVDIQEFNIQFEPVRKVHDELKREALDRTILMSYSQVSGGDEIHTWSSWKRCVGEGSLGVCVADDSLEGGISPEYGVNEPPCHCPPRSFPCFVGRE
jgi:hypothetical protein